MLSFAQIKKPSLQICRQKLLQSKQKRKRVLLLTTPCKTPCKKGSLTIEAALVLPMFLFAMLSIISLLSLLLFHMKLQGALHQQAKSIAQQAYIEWNFSEAEVQMGILDEVGESLIQKAPIKGGVSGISFSDTDLSDREFVKLSVSYEAELPYDFFHLFHRTFHQTALFHTWIGYEKGLDAGGTHVKEEYVYITETGEVYHRNRECSHIRLSIYEISAEELDAHRNASGGKYSSCEHCHSSLTGGVLYVTKDGDRYHNSLSCSGLKRTVIAVPISEVGNRRPCSGCGH